jgi:hypothetical protein
MAVKPEADVSTGGRTEGTSALGGGDARPGLAALLWAAIAAAAFAAPALADQSPVLEGVLPEQIFAPSGFDDNDNAQVVLRGVFPDSCYKVGPADFTVDHAKRVITITARAYHYRDSMCLQMRTPWIRALDLGVLRAGRYALVAKLEGKGEYRRGELPVGVARRSGPDDHDYAQVTDAVVSGLEPGGTPELRLFGTFHLTCVRLQEVRTIYDAPNVIEVLPIIEVSPDVPCAYPFLPIQFRRTVRLERKWHGPVLIHVRSVEGSAVNRVVEFP